MDTGHISDVIHECLELGIVILITSRPIYQNTKPKRSAREAKFIKTRFYEYSMK